MIGRVGEALHLLAAQAGLQPFDQSGQAFVFFPGRREQLGIRRFSVDHVGATQAQFERGGLELQVREPLSQQHEQVAGVARGRGQRDGQLADRRAVAVAPVTLFVVHEQHETLHQHLTRARPRQQRFDQQARAVQHLAGGVGTGQQFDARLEHLGQRDPGRWRVGTLAQCALEFVEQRITQTRDQTGSRQATQITQGVQTHAFEHRAVIADATQQPHWRGIERTAQRCTVGAVLGRWQTQPRHAGEQRRAQGGGRTGDAHRVTERPQRGVKALHQRDAAAEITQAGLHLQQHGVRSLSFSRGRRRPAARG